MGFSAAAGTDNQTGRFSASDVWLRLNAESPGFGRPAGAIRQAPPLLSHWELSNRFLEGFSKEIRDLLFAAVFGQRSMFYYHNVNQLATVEGWVRFKLY